MKVNNSGVANAKKLVQSLGHSQQRSGVLAVVAF